MVRVDPAAAVGPLIHRPPVPDFRYSIWKPVAAAGESVQIRSMLSVERAPEVSEAGGAGLRGERKTGLKSESVRTKRGSPSNWVTTT